jgi:hypothetical protein
MIYEILRMHHGVCFHLIHDENLTFTSYLALRDLRVNNLKLRFYTSLSIETTARHLTALDISKMVVVFRGTNYNTVPISYDHHLPHSS